ncbi:hypothetical protein [Anaerosalibacter sp. Marseille-P3206]|uniref:hypothetical protein n=1 Tax=Anaerosalibacter sp. Marseille-P3206 TaxID=1871005 RepID=UPI000985302A|nr:hypothetical protein [Anaerosalibacter sp. Marseille-P3206]
MLDEILNFGRDNSWLLIFLFLILFLGGGSGGFLGDLGNLFGGSSDMLLLIFLIFLLFVGI